ncbi:MAG: SusC/RagA family TonB-linked outer membrane protein [Ginsengibacter sp.]
MKKSALLAWLFLLFCAPLSVFAQARTITGKVLNESGGAVPMATIQEKGTRNTVTATDQGVFTITLKGENPVLVISSVNYQQQQVTVGNETFLNVQMKQAPQLSEVIVTALGITRQKRSLGYSAQSVDAQQITESHQTNLINALQGKVAGVTISSAGGGPGQGASILIRGINSLDPGKNSQPLFVIDGLPIDNSTFTTGTDGNRGTQMPNRVSDINPEDIESVNILRGGAATALYGLRGSNGVVVITTKSGQAGRLRVNFSSSYSIDKVDKYPEQQLKYTQGYYTTGYDSTSFWPAWGPTVEVARQEDPSHPAKLENTWKRAYNTGHQYNNAISFAGGTDKATFSSSFSYAKQDGLIPFTWYQDATARVSGQLKFSDKFKMGTNLYYANTDGNFYDADRYNEELIYWAPRWDVRDYKKPDGTLKTYGNGNPIYYAATNKFRSNVDHVIGSVNFNYAPVSWFTANYMLGIDEYGDARTATAPGPLGIPGEIIADDNGQGFVHEYRLNYRQLNSNLLLTFDHTWADKFQTTLRVGNDVLDRKLNRVSAEGDELDVYNLFNLGNAKTVAISQYKQNYRIIGAYGDLTLAYNNFLYLNLTGRNDWTSTLEANNRSFFYPSASISYVFTQNLKLPVWLSYGKLRASLAAIGKDADPYSTSIVYNPITPPVNGVVRWGRGNQAGVSDLKPEKTTSFEVGTDLNFLNNRLGFNFTWYKSNSKDQIIPVSTAPTSGFTSIYLNAGEIENKGLELTLKGTPVKTKNFNWDVTLNYSANRNKIISIYPGLQEIVIGSQYGYSNSSVTMKYVPGESAGDIYGTPWTRYGDNKNPDALYADRSLPLLIGSNGFPVLTPSSDQKILGNSYPKWLAGIANNFTYKNWSLYMLWDTRQGLQKFDQFYNFMTAFGETPLTLNREQTIVFDGVLADGSKNTKPVYLGQGVGPDGHNYGVGYYRNVFRGISENFVEDASFVKLRTLSLTYSLPNDIFKNSFINKLSLSLTGNNLILITSYKGFDPESSSTPAGSSANGFAGFSYPALRSYIVSLNVGF